jgi:hypothetical protein
VAGVGLNGDHSGMLDALDEIDWVAVPDGYGSATDAPRLLRAIADGDASAAVDDLYQSLCHQGTVYPAAVPSIQFVAELVADETQPPRVRVLLVCLLAFISEGFTSPQNLAVLDAARYEVRRVSPALLARYADEVEAVQFALAGLAAHVPSVAGPLTTLLDAGAVEAPSAVGRALLGLAAEVVRGDVNAETLREFAITPDAEDVLASMNDLPIPRQIASVLESLIAEATRPVFE